MAKNARPDFPEFGGSRVARAWKKGVHSACPARPRGYAGEAAINKIARSDW